MKKKCFVCKEYKDGVMPRFVRNEYKDPDPPFTQRQLIAKTLAMCESCYKQFQRGEISI